MRSIIIFVVLIWFASPITAAAVPPTADQRFQMHSAKVLAEMWREFPEFAVSVGYYKYADRMTVPNMTRRNRSLAFYNRQLAALAKFDASKLSAANQVDLALLQNQFESSRFNLITLASRASTWRRRVSSGAYSVVRIKPKSLPTL